jgi:hypothetical protein
MDESLARSRYVAAENAGQLSNFLNVHYKLYLFYLYLFFSLQWGQGVINWILLIINQLINQFLKFVLAYKPNKRRSATRKYFGHE